MYRAEVDGSATVWQIPVRPFVRAQHMQIDVTALNRLANYALRFARERGWLQTRDALDRSTLRTSRVSSSSSSSSSTATRQQQQQRPRCNAGDVGGDSGARPLVEQEGYAPSGEDRTVFYAGVDVTLTDALLPHSKRTPTSSLLLFCAQLWVAHVGNSSYTIRGELHAYHDGEAVCASRPLGSFAVTCVAVSSVLRRAVTLSPPRRRVMEQALQLHQRQPERRDDDDDDATSAADEGHAHDSARGDSHSSHGHTSSTTSIASDEHSKLCRLDVHALTRCCCCCTPTSTRAAMTSTAEAAAAAVSGEACDGDASSTLYTRTYVLRLSDMDFNRHLNQLATMQLVTNTLRAAVADAASVYACLASSDADALSADLLVRRLRIDYVREVPMHHEALEVRLCARNDDARDALRARRNGTRVHELVELAFVTRGVARYNGAHNTATDDHCNSNNSNNNKQRRQHGKDDEATRRTSSLQQHDHGGDDDGYTATVGVLYVTV